MDRKLRLCEEKGLHLSGCSQCSELEYEVEKAQECCRDAHERIDTKADQKTVEDLGSHVDAVEETLRTEMEEGDEALDQRIDNIIAGDAPSAAEVIDARVGEDGVIYPTLGGAIRGQVGDIWDMIAGVESVMTATKAYAVGDYLIVDGTLYVVTANIANGGAIVVGTNVEETNLGDEVSDISASIGDLASLTTTDKSSIVAAINENTSEISDVKEDFDALGLSVVNGEVCQTYNV